MALRFFLGTFEAGFVPGVPYLFSFFYRRQELGARCGFFASAAPLASTFGGALAYGITSGHPLLSSWRLLFLVEGVPTIIGSILAFLFLPDDPGSARFLTEEEKEVAKNRALRRTGQEEQKRGVNWKESLQTFLDLKSWLIAVGEPISHPVRYIKLTRSVSSSYISAAMSASLLSLSFFQPS